MTPPVEKKSGARKKLLPGMRVSEGYLRHPFDEVVPGIQTSGLIAGRNLETGHPHDRHSTAYFGVAPSVFRALVERWRESISMPIGEYSFIDMGAGMGRAMLLAAEFPFKEVVGVELHADLARIAKRNIATWKSAGRAKCAMRAVIADATDVEFPANRCVVFLFNPFSGTVLRRVLKRIATVFADRPGQVDLLYVNHEFEFLIREHKGFERVWRGDISKSAGDEAADRRILLNQPDGEYAASEYEECSIYRWVGIGAAKQKIKVIRAGQKNVAEAMLLLNEYYEAVHVIRRDGEQAIAGFLNDPASGMWIAYANAEPAGCVVLRPVAGKRGAAEFKRLYVRPQFRGKGIAEKLIDTVEEFAVAAGWKWMYLDSKDELRTAVAIYERRGYKRCKRYNDNPQATIFMRKKIG